MRTGLSLPVAELIELLDSAVKGDPKTAEELLPLVYQELRSLAVRKMAGQASGHTLQATALVHEAYLRLAASERKDWDGRAHFFAAAAEAMRHILVDAARRKQRAKHGGALQRVDANEIEIAAELDDEKLLLVNESLDKLALEDPFKAQVVKLHYFAGLTHAEAAEVLKVSEKTIRRHWNYARVWLFQSIEAAPLNRSSHCDSAARARRRDIPHCP